MHESNTPEAAVRGTGLIRGPSTQRSETRFSAFRLLPYSAFLVLSTGAMVTLLTSAFDSMPSQAGRELTYSRVSVRGLFHHNHWLLYCFGAVQPLLCSLPSLSFAFDTAFRLIDVKSWKAVFATQQNITESHS